MTKKDLFKARLSGKNGVIDFGFIPRWDRRAFVRFCKDNKLVIPFPDGFANFVYKANDKFTYEITYSSSFLFAWICEITADFQNMLDGKNRKEIYWTSRRKFTIKPRKPDNGYNWLHCYRNIIF